MNLSPCRLAFLLALVAAVPLRSAAADAPAAAPSNTLLSDRTVQILWEADAPPPDVSGILNRIFGEASTGRIAQRVLGLRDTKVGPLMAWRDGALEVKDRSCTLGFRVVLNNEHAAGARPAAKEFADALVDELTESLRADRRAQIIQRLERVAEEAHELEKALAEKRTEARDRQAKLLVMTDRADLSATSLQASIARLEDERQRLELDLAGMEARLEAVQEQFKSSSDKAKDQASADPVVAELEKAVAVREKLLDILRKQYEAGQAPMTDVAKAEADVVDARVSLLDRRGAASSRGGDALAPLTREMQNLGIDIRDRKARLAQVERRLKPLRNVAQDFQQLEWQQEETAILRRGWEEAQLRLREVQRQVDAAPVDRVIVTRAKDSTKLGE